MDFNFMSPGLTDDEVKEAVSKNGPRELAQPGRYTLRLHSIRGRKYTRADGSAGESATLFFINKDGNYKGAELTLFRVGGNAASTTSQSAVIAVGIAAGLNPAQIKDLNWALTDEAIDERGNVKAALGTAETGPLSIEGLEFVGTVDISVNEKTGYESNVVKYIKPAVKV